MSAFQPQRFVQAKLRSLWDKGYFHMVVALGSVQVLALLLRIVLGRVLTLDEFARISLLIESINFSASLITLGLPSAMMWHGVKEQRVADHLSGALRIMLAAALVLLAGYGLMRIGWALFQDETANRLVDRFIVLAVPFALFNYVGAYLTADKRGNERAWLIVSQRTSFFVLVAGGALWLAWPGALWGYVLHLLLFPAAMAWRYRRAIFRRVRDYPYRSVLAYSGWDSLGFIPTSAAMFLMLNITERGTGDMAAVSHLAIAMSLSVMARYAFASLQDIFFPYLMEKQNHREFGILLGKILAFFAMLVVGVLAVAYIIVPPLIPILLGERFAPAIPLFKIVVLGEIVMAFASLGELTHQVFRMVRFKAICLWLALLCYGTVLHWLTTTYGVQGAALAFIVFSGVRLVLAAAGVLYALSGRVPYPGGTGQTVSAST